MERRAVLAGPGAVCLTGREHQEVLVVLEGGSRREAPAAWDGGVEAEAPAAEADGPAVLLSVVQLEPA